VLLSTLQLDKSLIVSEPEQVPRPVMACGVVPFPLRYCTRCYLTCSTRWTLMTRLEASCHSSEPLPRGSQIGTIATSPYRITAPLYPDLTSIWVCWRTDKQTGPQPVGALSSPVLVRFCVLHYWLIRPLYFGQTLCVVNFIRIPIRPIRFEWNKVSDFQTVPPVSKRFATGGGAMLVNF